MAGRYDKVNGIWMPMRARADKIWGVWTPVQKRYDKISGLWMPSYTANPWSIVSNDFGSGGLISMPYPATDANPLILQVSENSLRELNAIITYPHVLVPSDVITVDCAVDRTGSWHLELHAVQSSWYAANAMSRTTLSFTGNSGAIWFGLWRSKSDDGYVAYYGRWTIYGIYLNGTKIY